jgi:hypothetical protein
VVLKNQSEPGIGDREESDAAREQHDGLRRQLGSACRRWTLDRLLVLPGIKQSLNLTAGRDPDGGHAS